MTIAHSWVNFAQARWFWLPRIEALEPRIASGFTVDWGCFRWYVTGA